MVYIIYKILCILCYITVTCSTKDRVNSIPSHSYFKQKLYSIPYLPNKTNYFLSTYTIIECRFSINLPMQIVYEWTPIIMSNQSVNGNVRYYQIVLRGWWDDFKTFTSQFSFIASTYWWQYLSSLRSTYSESITNFHVIITDTLLLCLRNCARK